jgi:CubicO group peptidase (beta-lactamase class C family)
MRASSWALGGLACLCLASAARAEDPHGDWTGALATPRGALHVVVRVQSGPGGAPAAMLDSPDQGFGDLPLTAVVATETALSFKAPALNGAYDGKWDSTAGQWVGTWTQGGAALPLDLRRGTPPRPQSLCPQAKPSPWPNRCDIMFWTPAEQALAYRHMDKSFAVRLVPRGGPVLPLPTAAKPLDVRFDYEGTIWTTDDLVRQTRVAGLLVVKDGKVLLERYGMGETADDRWTTMSVTKSVTSTLVGAAIKDGAISSLDAQVTDYLPELKGSAYDGVTVRQLLTMTSGVKWNENYGDPAADIDHFDRGETTPPGADPVLTYMAKLPRAAPPGTKFLYSTGDATLAGILVAHATHRRLADYLSQKIWGPVGMQRDAYWILDRRGVDEVAGGCISMTLRDEARFALFFMGGGLAHGQPVLPDGWTADATANHDPAGPPYGYLWWPRPVGYDAVGIFGQTLYVDPADHLVVVIQSAWPFASDVRDSGAQRAFLEAVLKAVHGAAAAK